MTEREMEAYYRIAAPYYDQDYGDIWHGQDIDFYFGLAKQSGGPVLEMGCGTGRVLLPLARRGIAMYGLDSSAAMLGQLRRTLARDPEEVQQRVCLTQGDIRSADLGRRFPLITAPGNVLQSLFERQDQQAWFRNVRRHLLPDGSLCLDAFQPDSRRIAAPAEWVNDVDRIDSTTGNWLRRFTCIHHEPELQRFRVEMRWLTEDSAGRTLEEKSSTMMQTWFTPGELESLIESEGFRITNCWGSFNRTPFESGSPQQVIEAKVAG